MNTLTNDSAAEVLGIREAAVKLLADLDTMAGASVAAVLGVSRLGKLGSIEALRRALQKGRTAILMISDPAAASEGIARMKAGEEITPNHIHAIVEAAEAALENESNGIMRFEADMRAIKLWQSGGAPGEDRSLIWPDHADLVVWLLDLLWHRPAVPALAVVETVANNLESMGPQTPLAIIFTAAKQGADALRQVANALIFASRRNFSLEAARDQLIESLRHAKDSLRAVLDRPDVKEALAKAVCSHNGGDWAQANEEGRQAFREEAARLCGLAISAPR